MAAAGQIVRAVGLPAFPQWHSSGFLFVALVSTAALTPWPRNQQSAWHVGSRCRCLPCLCRLLLSALGSFYLWFRSPGKNGSHYDPNCDLFQPSEKRMVLTSDAFMLGMVGVLAAATAKLGLLNVLNLYVLPYW